VAIRAPIGPRPPPVALAHCQAWPEFPKFGCTNLAWMLILTPVPETKDERLAGIAEPQAGVVTNRQLRDGGLSAKDIKVRLRRGSLSATPARGVYRVAGAERSWRQDLWVALLAGPNGTLASHVSAAALRGLIAPPSIPQVTVPRDASGRFRGAAVHHAAVSDADRAQCEGLDTTALGRTLVDCAAALTQRALNELVDAAFGRGLCAYEATMQAWERAGHVRGGERLETALAPYATGARPGSVGAAHVLRKICDWGLPLPLCEYEIRDEHGEWVATVDFAWPAWWFVLEYDGGAGHGPRRLRVDARRQAAIERIGWQLERADRFDARPSSTRLFDVLNPILTQPPAGENVIHLPSPIRRRSRRRSSAQ
jgi:hypothetical protein